MRCTAARTRTRAPRTRCAGGMRSTSACATKTCSASTSPIGTRAVSSSAFAARESCIATEATAAQIEGAGRNERSVWRGSRVRIPEPISEGRHGALRNALPALRAVEVHLDRNAAAAAAAGGADHHPLTASDLCRGARETLELARNAGRHDAARDGSVLALGAAASVQVTGRVKRRWVCGAFTGRTLFGRVSAFVRGVRTASDAGAASCARRCAIL